MNEKKSENSFVQDQQSTILSNSSSLDQGFKAVQPLVETRPITSPPQLELVSPKALELQSLEAAISLQKSKILQDLVSNITPVPTVAQNNVTSLPTAVLKNITPLPAAVLDNITPLPTAMSLGVAIQEVCSASFNETGVTSVFQIGEVLISFPSGAAISIVSSELPVPGLRFRLLNSERIDSAVVKKGLVERFVCKIKILLN